MIKITFTQCFSNYLCNVKISAIIFSITFSALILFNSLRASCAYVYYELDPVGFIEKLCENKDKPELQCNGKCFLKKVIESNSNNESSQPSQLIDFKEILLYSQKTFSYQFNSKNNIEKSIFKYNNLYTFTTNNSCFKPPQV